MVWQWSTNQKALPDARAEVECGAVLKIQNFTQASYVYLTEPGPGSQETWVPD